MINYARAFYYLHNLLKRAYWSSDKLENYQNKRLRSIITYAYDYVPFYHKKLRELEIKPTDIKTKGDLNKLPIIRKNEIRDNLKEMISTEYNLNDLKMLSTSGSTGAPFFLYISKAENEFRKAKHLRANISCGQKPLDRWVTITAPHHFGESTKLQRRLGFFAPTPLSVFTDSSTLISTIEKINPNIVDGYSSSLFILAKELQKSGIEAIRPRLVFGGAELIDDHSREFVEKIFDAPFYDQYASVELERMAWQCPVAQEYHIDADAIIMQFVDTNGEEVSSGERGEIICTSLFNYAMPFIRYAIGDVGMSSEELCTCGRAFPLMKTVEGRKDSILLLPNGRSLTPRAFTIAMNMFKFYKYIDQFRIVQKKPDLFVFNIALKYGSVEKDIVEKELISHLRSTFNLEHVNFEVKFVDSIPLDKSGKLMAVVSNLK